MLWKIFSGVFFYSLLFLLMVLLLLQLRPVQTFLAQKVLEGVSQQTNHEISLSRVKVSWLDRANLEDILIKDLENDTLIYSGNLLVNYKISDLINGDYLNVEEIESQKLRLKLIKYDSESKLNLSQFLDALKKDTVKKESKPLYIDQITLSNLHLSLQDKSKNLSPNKLDFANLNFSIPDFAVSELAVESDTISGNIFEMTGVERNSNFTITEFATKFQFSSQALSIDDLEFRTPTSHITDSLEFFYNGLDDFGSFIDSVSFILHFKESKISRKDFKIVTGMDQVMADITIDGIIWGTVGDFNIEETRFGYGDSYFVGGVSCFGLPNISQTFVLADLTDSHILPRDLRPYIGEYADNLEQMGKIDFTGSFAGFLKDFVARGDFITNQGSVHTDINLKIPQDPNQMSYRGNLEFKDVNVGAFLKNDILQRVNLKASINGKGITPDNADFELKALIYQSGLKGYVYDTIEAEGKFAKNFFEGDFGIHDPNCDLVGKAQVDFRDEVEILDVEMDVKEFNPEELNLTTRSISSYGKIQVNVVDLDLDNFVGKLKIDSGLLTLDGKKVVLDSIRFTADYQTDSARLVKVAFPGFQSSLEGKFKFSDVIKDVPIMAAGYAEKLQLIKDTVDTKAGSGEDYKLTLNATVDNISSYLDSLRLPVSIGGKTVIESSYRQSKNVNISFFMEADTFFVGQNVFHHPILEIFGSKELDASGILTSFLFQSEKQEFAGMPNTEDLMLEGVWYDNNIDLTTLIGQPATSSNIRLESAIKLHSDSLTLKMLPSEIKLLDDNWTFNPTNQVVITRRNTSISNLEIYDSSESISVQGVYADSIPTSIEIITEDLNMNKASLFSGEAVGGFLNGNFRIFRQSSSEPFKFDGGFLLKNLEYGSLEVGDVSGSSRWNPSNKSVYTKVEVERKNVNAIQIEGFYYPTAATNQLDFDIKFDDAELKMGEPFLQENFDEIEGKAGGSLKVSGTVDGPKVVGNCNIQNGGVTIKYLNTHYKFDGRVDFDPAQIRLVNFDLVDRKGSNAIVSGYISHQSFSNLVTNMTIRANNFEFLNTTSIDNNLYYGSAYGTGTIDVTGPLNDLNIKANITTEADTRFFVPISEGTNVGQEEYISFVDFQDTTRIVAEDDFNISGLTLDFDIDVTPDAYCELIFNIKTGDIIRGRGRGNLKLRLDTDGEFNMFGPLEITEGAYNFTVPNLLNKEFEVVPGSRITWYGDPYNATLDLDATYLQRASFEELDNPAEQDPNLLANKVPILVILRIQGGMLSPEIDFDLELQNESDASQDNIPLLSQITSDEQELKRQVISLLFLKRFSPRQSFTLSGGGSVGNSVSEFLSSQVSYLVSQIDENLEVEVNLADLNSDAFNTFQLRFAYTFLDGRLKVTRGGDFGSQNDQNDNVLNDIVGDWSVEYSLTKDGRLRAKVFRNTDQRIQINDNQQNQETGISLRFVHSFNDLTELLTMKRNEALLRREDENEEDQEDTNTEIKDSTK
ncbi:translocation/assembly module TamB domain-containing protein [Ekhidna sp.]|uniref:translocation/assembly module TamB domain-containing protein n=1 Tax=Ekhidna sp. TaxID=2608089 RepID=UPI0032F026F7